MLELPRALVVDSQQVFASAIVENLRACSPEIAVKIVTSIDDAMNALQGLRPQIMFINWTMGSSDHQCAPTALLRTMADLMESDPINYDYPLVINSNWHQEYQRDWEAQGVIFQMENPWVTLDRNDTHALTSIVSRWYVRKIQPRRMLRLAKGSVDVARCAYIRVSDGPAQIHFWHVGENRELTIARHRDDTFQLISQELLTPFNEGAMAISSSLFVKANQRSTLVNLAVVERIAYDASGEREFVFGNEGSAPVRLNVTVTHSVARTLEVIKHLNFWPHLAHLTVPG